MLGEAKSKPQKSSTSWLHLLWCSTVIAAMTASTQVSGCLSCVFLLCVMSTMVMFPIPFEEWVQNLLIFFVSLLPQWRITRLQGAFATGNKMNSGLVSCYTQEYGLNIHLVTIWITLQVTMETKRHVPWNVVQCQCARFYYFPTQSARVTCFFHHHRAR